MRRASLLAALTAALATGLTSAGAGPRLDYAGVARNVLPPGQSGSLFFPKTSTDQLELYDGLTPRFGSVGARDVERFFKSARFGPDGKAMKVERPRAGLRIVRDRWDVPHVYGRTRADVAYGAGWATAADRGLLMNLLRGPGRVAAIDAPGLDAFALATSARQFVSTPQTEAFLAAQVELLRRQGPKGRLALQDVDAYVAGINGYNRAKGFEITPWARNDVIAVATLIGAVFGAGGGDEARRSQFLSALQQRLGAEGGRAVWDDLRQQQNPEAPVSVDGRFEYGTHAGEAGNAVLDEGSLVPARSSAAPERHQMSNALLVAANRAAGGHPLFVAGPQTGHLYPQILMEIDLHGGGVDARGAAFPGVSLYALIGRGRDYAWSATSAGSDIIDEYVEELCGDDTHYRYQGSCREMERFDAGVLRGTEGRPDQPVVFRTTVHGPVVGYASVKGRKVAIARKRSTRGRELVSLLHFADLNRNAVTSAQSFFRTASQMELTFNWLYADDRDIAQFTSGRLPVRPPQVEPGLPTLGTGEYEWSGFVPFAGHARVVNPRGGLLTNWNNKPALGFAAADDDWSYGSVQRVELLRHGLAGRQKHTLASVVAAMNKAATQDLRVIEIWPVIRAALGGGGSPSARAAAAADLVDGWLARGGSRLDRDLDGKIDDPGAAIMDAAWPRLADAVMSPVLGPLVDRLAALNSRGTRPGSNGNAFGGGWYGYVEKDLRSLLGQPVQQPFSTRFCGAGDRVACRDALWAALDAACAELAGAQGPDAAAWRADATRERVSFGAFMKETMRFANRPTFQQVMTFTGHRPR
ncbi:MAG: penicillin acylase family protein [Gaiellaceae bacterium]